MADNLKLSPKLKAPGLFIYCNSCKRDPKNGICYKTKEICKEGNRHVFKVRIHISGTTNRKRTKVLTTRDPIQAAKQAIELHDKLKGSEVPVRITKELHLLMNKFMDTNRNPEKNRIAIDEETLKDYQRHLTYFIEVTAISKLKQLTKESASHFFASMSSFSPNTKDKYFRTLRTFYNFLVKDQGLTLPPNPFNGWNFDKPEPTNDVITQKEFKALLRNIDTMPKAQKDDSGNWRRLHYTWLKDAFRLALYSGARRQEVAAVRWSDIIPGPSGLKWGVLLLRDRKVEQITKRKNIIKPVEINEDLAELLMEMGYKKGRDDGYIIAPDAVSRKGVCNDLSRSFAYYIGPVNDVLSFSCLRKTWFTSFAQVMGPDKARQMGGHSGIEVTNRHYINKVAAVGSKGKFKRVFG